MEPGSKTRIRYKAIIVSADFYDIRPVQKKAVEIFGERIVSEVVSSYFNCHRSFFVAPFGNSKEDQESSDGDVSGEDLTRKFTKYLSSITDKTILHPVKWAEIIYYDEETPGVPVDCGPRIIQSSSIGEGIAMTQLSEADLLIHEKRVATFASKHFVASVHREHSTKKELIDSEVTVSFGAKMHTASVVYDPSKLSQQEAEDLGIRKLYQHCMSMVKEEIYKNG